MIGQGIFIVICPALLYLIIKRKTKIESDDGNIKRIVNNRSKYPSISDFDLNPDAEEFNADSLVMEE